MTFFLISFLVSIFGAIFGIGGGIAYVPLLWKLGFSFNQAATYSLYFVAVSALSAAGRYHSKNLIEWQLVVLFVPMTIIGAFISGYFAGNISQRLLLAFFTLSASVSSYKLLKKNKFFETTDLDRPLTSREGWLCLPLGLVSGAFASLIGKGGGLLFVPILLYIYRRSLKRAVATSLTIIIFTAFAGLTGRLLSGFRLPFEVLWGGMGGVIGARIGVYVQGALPQNKLQPSAGIFFMTVAAYIFYYGVLFPG